MIWKNVFQKTLFLLFGLAISWTLPLYVWTLDLHAFEERTGLIETSKGWYHWVELPTPSGILIKTIQLIQLKSAKAEELPLGEQIEAWIRYNATKWGLNEKIFRGTLYCESNLNPNARGDYRSETGEFMANGIAQFWRGTFERFKAEAGMPELKYESWRDQISLMGYMWSKNLQYHWKNCYNYIKKNAK